MGNAKRIFLPADKPLHNAIYWGLVVGFGAGIGALSVGVVPGICASVVIELFTNAILWRVGSI